MNKELEHNENDKEPGEEHLAELIKLAGEDARARYKKTMDAHYQKLKDCAARAMADLQNQKPS